MEHEATWISVQHLVSIPQAFQGQVCVQRRALVGVLKIVSYLRELEVGTNARYRSHTIIGKFLQVLAAVVEEQFSALKCSKFSLC